MVSWVEEQGAASWPLKKRAKGRFDLVAAPRKSLSLRSTTTTTALSSSFLFNEPLLQLSSTVYVGNVESKVDEFTIKSIFQNCGAVTNVRLAG